MNRTCIDIYYTDVGRRGVAKKKRVYIIITVYIYI